MKQNIRKKIDIQSNTLKKIPTQKLQINEYYSDWLPVHTLKVLFDL